MLSTMSKVFLGFPSQLEKKVFKFLQVFLLFLRSILKLFELCIKVVGLVSRNLRVDKNMYIWIFRSSINWLIVKKISPCFAKHCQNNLYGVKM